MKKIVLSLGFFALLAGSSIESQAQNNAGNQQTKVLDGSQMKFLSEIHDFGNIPQNIPVEHDFVFTNTGKEPITIDRVQATCGCTAPSYSKEPVLPGQKGTIKAAFNAAAAGHFSKTITVASNVGIKVLTIKGNVDKAPENSVPSNNSVIKK